MDPNPSNLPNQPSDPSDTPSTSLTPTPTSAPQEIIQPSPSPGSSTPSPTPILGGETAIPTQTTTPTPPANTPIVTQGGMGISPDKPSLNQVPNDFASKDPSGSAKPKSKKSKKFIIMIVVLVLLLGGGSAFAFTDNYLRNLPKNVVGQGLLNLLSAKNGIGGFSLNDSIQGSGSSSPGYQVIVNGGSDQNENTRADVEIDISILKITFSAIVRPTDHELYLKSDQISTLLGYLSSLGVGTTTQLSTLAKQLNGNWLQIDVSGLQSIGGITAAQASKANDCIDAFSQAITTQKTSFVSNLESAYKANMFLNAQKVGSATINGSSTNKYLVTINQANISKFDKAFSTDESTESKSLSKVCGSSTTKSVSGDVAENTSSPSTIYLWINSSKNIVQASVAQKVGGSTNNITIDFNNQSFDASTPSPVVTLPELKTTLDSILPELGQSSSPTASFSVL